VCCVFTGGCSSASGLKSSQAGGHLTRTYSSNCRLKTQDCPVVKESQSYFITGGLPPISSSWRQAPGGSRREIFYFQLNPCGYSPGFVKQIMPIFLSPLSSQSQSHIATDGQSVSKFWYRAPSGAHDQIFISV
jgi:hypothetical protein